LRWLAFGRNVRTLTDWSLPRFRGTARQAFTLHKPEGYAMNTKFGKPGLDRFQDVSLPQLKKLDPARMIGTDYHDSFIDIEHRGVGGKSLTRDIAPASMEFVEFHRPFELITAQKIFQ